MGNFRLLKDGNIALDTMSGIELLSAATLCLAEGVGDKRYLAQAKGIIEDRSKRRHFYVTLPMRRTLMGFIRPVFEEEYRNRYGKKKLTRGGKPIE